MGSYNTPVSIKAPVGQLLVGTGTGVQASGANFIYDKPNNTLQWIVGGAPLMNLDGTTGDITIQNGTVPNSQLSIGGGLNLNWAWTTDGGGGQHAPQINNTSTGTKTATFVSTNKPGGLNSAPVDWATVLRSGGGVGYIPIFG